MERRRPFFRPSSRQARGPAPQRRRRPMRAPRLSPRLNPRAWNRHKSKAPFPPAADAGDCGRPMGLARPIPVKQGDRTRARTSPTTRRRNNREASRGFRPPPHTDDRPAGSSRPRSRLAKHPLIRRARVRDEKRRHWMSLGRGAGTAVSVTVSGEVETLSVV
jgi:hypothetical protein